VSSVPATAADAILRAAPAASWSGCHVGTIVGFAYGNADAVDLPFVEGPFAGSGVSWNSPPGPANETFSADDSSMIIGGQVGCDYEVQLGGVGLVFGAATDINALRLSGTGTSAQYSDVHNSFDANWAATVRGRVGVATSDRLLFYATGGYAVAGIDVSDFDLSRAPTPGLMSVSGGGTESGWVAGGGVEWRFAPSWTMSVEYLHFDFGDIVATGPATFPEGAFPRFGNDVTFDTLRMGLNFGLYAGGDPTPYPEYSESPDAWKFTAAPYLWAAGLKGDIGEFGIPPVYVDATFADILKNFDVGFMGAGEARYGRFGIATDMLYLKISASAETPLGVLADHIDATSKTFTAFGAAEYRLVDTERASLDVLGGARVWALSTDLDPVGGAADPLSFSDDFAWVDPIVGGKARVNLSDNYYLTGWGMIGGFGAGSKLTWDAMGAVGYELNNRVSFIGGWRALSVDYEKGSDVFDVVMSGPILGATIKF
jgi:opacity protein-like surface antigen